MNPWQVAASLGVGAFVCFLFYRLATKVFPGSATASVVLPIVIFIIFGGLTALALVQYAPSAPTPGRPISAGSAIGCQGNSEGRDCVGGAIGHADTDAHVVIDGLDTSSEVVNDTGRIIYKFNQKVDRLAIGGSQEPPSMDALTARDSGFIRSVCDFPPEMRGMFQVRFMLDSATRRLIRLELDKTDDGLVVSSVCIPALEDKFRAVRFADAADFEANFRQTYTVLAQ